jgi:acyl-CoA synthetase (NDP forming)/GNAT superfamily N-acetyltransferase
MTASPASEAILARFARDVLLATGTSIHVRASEVTDVPAMHAFYDGLSDRSAYFRFFGLRPAHLEGLLHPADGQDVRNRVVLLALLAGTVIGIGEYSRITGRDEVEAAFAVADRHQQEGIATVLVEDLAMIATEAGFTKLVAETMATNDAMLDVFRSVGLRHHSRYESGQVHVELTLTGESLLEDRSDSRDWRAAVASLEPVLRPGHVAVFGGGAAPSAGGAIAAKLAAGFVGRLSVVDPAASDVAIGTVSAVAELDAAPDLAIVAVPGPLVVDAIDECGRAGVKAVVVVAADGTDATRGALDHERAVLDRARRYGMRVVGPDSLGVMSSAAALDATLLRRPLPPGDVAIACQSPAVGVILADEAARRHLGVTHFVSLGSKVDVSGNDLLRFWCDDRATAVVLLHLESIGDPRRFARIARAVAKRMPIVALKSGRSTPAGPADESPAAVLAAGEAAVDALFAHTGVVRATSVDQLLDAGLLLRAVTAPTGRRVGIVGNAGGALVHAADAARARGLVAVELSPALQATVRGFVPGAAATDNPVDLPAATPGGVIGEVVGELGRSGEVDSLVVVNVDVFPHDGSSPLHLDAIDAGVPVVVAAVGGSAVTGTVPVLPTAERAVDAMALAVRRGEWLATGADDTVTVELDDLVPVRLAVRALLPRPPEPGAAGAAAERRWLAPDVSLALLETVGVPLAPWRIARTAAEAGRAARAVGVPCVATATLTATGFAMTSDNAATVIEVASAAAAQRALHRFVEQYGPRLEYVVFQRSAPDGIELLVGGVRDDSLGPLVVVAAGGSEAEVLADRNVVLAPLTSRQATAAVTTLRSFPLFNGFRGRPVVPVAPVAAVVERVGLLLAAFPEIAEVDLDPTVATPDGCEVYGARVAVSPAPLGPLRALRPLRRRTRRSEAG